MTPTKIFTERRSAQRPGELHLRRRHSQAPATRSQERRRSTGGRFEIAAALERNLDRYPTKAGMLTLLQSWLYAAEGSRVPSSEPYAQALGRAVEIMKESPDPPHAIVQLWRSGSDSMGMSAA